MEKELKPGKFLKRRIIKEYADQFKGASAMFVTEFIGLTNKELEDLRKKLTPVSIKYLIVKNSLCKIALKDIKMDSIADMLEGSCALGYGKADPVSVSKVLINFAKANEKFKLRGGYVDGEVVTVDTIKELASLPTREILLARLLNCMNSPISGFVSVCSGITKKLLYAFNEIIKKKEE